MPCSPLACFRKSEQYMSLVLTLVIFYPSSKYLIIYYAGTKLIYHFVVIFADHSIESLQLSNSRFFEHALPMFVF